MHDQCAFGGIAQKATCISSNSEHINDMDQIFCPGLSEQHCHAKTAGFDAQGHHLTRRLQTYSPGYAHAIAAFLFKSLKRMWDENAGPTGALMGKGVCKVSHYGARHVGSKEKCVSVLNEDVVLGRHVMLDPWQSAVYLHVDDTVCLSSTASHVPSDDLMVAIADSMESGGFVVPDRTPADKLEKVIGYKIMSSPARFRLPDEKWVLLREAFMEQHAKRLVQAEVLRALTGVWIFGALLRRDLLCLPHALFNFIDVHLQRGLVRWTSTARNEWLQMAQVLPVMYADVGAPVSNVMFATDAMGSDVSGDHGGYGAVVAEFPTQLIRKVLEVGCTPGKTVARLSGDQSGLKFPDKPASRTTLPFTRLPQEIFAPEHWHDFLEGRWMMSDHITLGEARTVTKLVRQLACDERAHRHVVISLQDNQPVSFSHAKGRATSWPLNRNLRQKAASLIASRMRLMLPWVQSALQPADDISRRIPSLLLRP